MPFLHDHIPLARSAALALVACLALAAPTLASHEPPRLGLTPIGEDGQFFDLSLEPGESQELQVEVANFGHDELLARTFAADGYSIINGGFAANLFGEPASGTTRWLDYPTQELDLGSGQGLIIEFSVSVPPGTPAGEYITAIVAENVDPYADADVEGVAWKQVNRTVVAVNINVPGPRHPELQIGAISHKEAAGTSFVTFEVANGGNVHLKPAGEFTLRDADGLDIAGAEPAMDSVYAGGETLVELPLANALAPGDYCGELRLTDEATGATGATSCLPFTVAVPIVEPAIEVAPPLPIVQPALDAVQENPLPVGLAALGAVGFSVALYLGLRRRRRRQLLARAVAAWPSADGGGADSPPRVASPASAETALLEVIRRMPEVRRAWLIRHDDFLELAVEAAPGMDLGAGSRMARTLQISVGETISGVPLRVVFLGGPGIVARRTLGVTPLYAARP